MVSPNIARLGYLGRQVTYASLQQVLLDGPAHQIVVHRAPRHLLVQLDGLVVVAFHGRKVGRLEEQLVGQSVLQQDQLSLHEQTHRAHAEALSSSYHPAATS